MQSRSTIQRWGWTGKPRNYGSWRTMSRSPRVLRLSFLPFTFLADIVPLGSLRGGFHFWAGDHSGNGTGRPARQERV